MRTMTKAGPGAIDDVFTLRQHIAELEGLETPEGPVMQAPAVNKPGRRMSMKQAPEGIFISTRQGCLIDGNQPLLGMMGYTIEEMFGSNIIDLAINPVDGAQFLKALDDKGYVIDYRMVLRKKDGGELRCMLTSTIRWYNDDNIPGNQPLYKTWVRPAK
jgi:PAS domain S-box-containing protein